MDENQLPEARFDEAQGMPYFPRPVIKRAALVPGFEGFATNLRPEWDDDGTNPQVFIGSYYLILDENGKGRYGSAHDQWVNMHRRVLPEADPTLWVKVKVPIGYHVSEPCVMITLIPEEDGSIRESKKAIMAGTLVLRQPGGEFQFVRPQDEAETYFSEVEARELGLFDMSAQQFNVWAHAQALAAFHAQMAPHI